MTFNGVDYTKNAGLPLDQLVKMTDDIRAQPEWRSEADRACAYYDSNQITPEMRKAMEERGQPVIIDNLMAPAIDGVLGLEARSRTDWMVRPDNDESVDMAEALNEKLLEAGRMTRADRACSDAFAAMVKCGLGWVEVSRNGDPFAYKWRVNYVNRNEIFWDWHDKSHDLNVARWLCRRRWVDEDEAVCAFPQHKDLIKMAVRCWASDDMTTALTGSPALVGAYSDYNDTKHVLGEWYDSDRRRILVNEVYYRHFVRGTVMISSDDQVIEFDKKNRVHVALVASGKVEVRNLWFPKMRLAYFIGAHRVVDVPSPHPHNYFPYVPFFGFREDSTGVPYGLGRRMMPKQDETNHRRSKLTHQLNSKTVIKDDDALLKMNDDQLMDEVYRADGVINLNPNRQNKDANAFRIETEAGIASQQFQVMLDSQKGIQDTAGVYSAFLGQEGGAQSGKAINSLVDQGSTTLAELTDNNMFARRMVGELLLANIVSDLAQKRNYEVRLNVGKPEKTKVIMLNGTVEGDEKVTNAVTKAKLQVVLSDIQSTPTYRAQMAERMLQMISALPEQAKMIMLDLVVESSDLPKKDEIIKRLRKMNGQQDNPEDLTPEEQQAMQAEQQKQAEIERIAMEEAQRKNDKLAAEARNTNARAAVEETKVGNNKLDQDHLKATTDLVIAQMKNMVAEVATKRRALSMPPPELGQPSKPEVPRPA